MHFCRLLSVSFPWKFRGLYVRKEINGVFWTMNCTLCVTVIIQDQIDMPSALYVCTETHVPTKMCSFCYKIQLFWNLNTFSTGKYVQPVSSALQLPTSLGCLSVPLWEPQMSHSVLYFGPHNSSYESYSLRFWRKKTKWKRIQVHCTPFLKERSFSEGWVAFTALSFW